MQTARERGVNVLLISEQYKWSDTLLGIRMHQGGPGSLFVALIGKSGILWSPTRGSFRWRWRVCVCTVSLNDPFEVFETQILLLEESLREAVGRTLLGGDFNSKSPEWGKARLDRREILVSEMVARNDLIVLNQVLVLVRERGIFWF